MIHLYMAHRAASRWTKQTNKRTTRPIDGYQKERGKGVPKWAAKGQLYSDG